MPKKSLIVTLVLTVVLMFASARLFVSHDFWRDWDINHAYLEVYNAGQEDNSFTFVDASRLKVEQPEKLKNPSWLENAGLGMLLQFKARPTYRKYSAELKAFGNGTLRIRFNNFEWNTAPRNITLSFRNVKINGKKVIEQELVDNGYVLPYDLKLKHGEVLTLSFEVKRYCNLMDLISKHVDWYVFIILLTMSFFFSYKVVRYLAKFKLQQSTSRIDIVFVTVFFLLLFVPMSHISDDKASNDENRVLAEYVPLYNEGINYKFGHQFEKWFNDRFLGRKKLIKIHNSLVERISLRGNHNVVVGKDGWLFLRSGGSIENFRNAVLFSDEELKNIGSYLSAIDVWAKKNGKDFYYVICPDKNKVYGENITFTSKIRPDSEGRTLQLINYLNENTKVKALYLKDALHANKGDNLLYFKNDTHWTTMGGYIGYVELMNKIREHHKYYPLVKFDKTQKIKSVKADLNKMYPAASEDNETEYEVPVFNNRAKCIDNKNKVQGLYCENTNLAKKLVLYRDSFSGGWLDFLNETFGKVTAFWRYDVTSDDLKYWKNEADIIILEQVERFVPKLVDYKFPE